ncbi:alpha/beta fold hydrolase [Aeromicrobium sp.]|uniref:alpha/beta fold hydrolase n=1 Tax=Aeromicrobium sp. TaxID=1871063 RepID=UPI003D6A9EB3
MTFDHLEPVTVGDLTFDVRTLGPDDGEPVMLLHGFPETSLSWSAVAPILAEAGFRVFAPDQRGYSPDARPTSISDYAMENLVADVLGLADALGLGTFHLVGHDWGAAVGWVVAAHHGDRLRTFTAVSVPHLAAYNTALRGDSDQQERASYIRLMRQEGKTEEVLSADDGRRLGAMYDGKIPATHVDAYLDFFREPAALTGALAWYRAMTAALADLPSVSVPTTFVWSDGDWAIGRASAEACEQHVTGPFTFVELTDVSHWIPEEAPAVLADATLDRLRG